MSFHELKSCPFCGARPYIESRSRAFINGETVRVAYVRCTECNARAERFPNSIGQRASVKLAVEAWNKRFDDVIFERVGDHIK